MHGPPPPPGPQPDALRSTMVCSSALDGSRQSHWPLVGGKPPPKLPLESPEQLPTPVAPPFSALRKLVNAVPSGAVPVLLQSYILLTLCGSLGSWLPPTTPSFISQISP